VAASVLDSGTAAVRCDRHLSALAACKYGSYLVFPQGSGGVRRRTLRGTQIPLGPRRA